MRMLRVLILPLAVLMFSACGGIQWDAISPSDGTPGDEDDGGETLVLPAPTLTHDEETRATVNIGGLPADGVDEVEINVDDGPFTGADDDGDCVDEDCDVIIPNLDPNDTYDVNIRYIKDGVVSEAASIQIDTTLKVKSAYGTADNANMGFALNAEGDLNGDGYIDIVAGPEPGTAADSRRVFFFTGGPDFDMVADVTVYTSNVNLTHGSALQVGDVNCDGYEDVLIGERQSAANEGRIFIIEGEGVDVPPGAYDIITARDHIIRDDDLNTRFGLAFDTVDNGSGCHDIVIGAPNAPGPGNGEVFYFPGSALTSTEIDVGNAYRIWTGAGLFPNAGRFVVNVGDPDADGIEEALFIAGVDGSLAPDYDLYLRFSDYAAADANWAIVNYTDNGSHMGAAGFLDGDDFFISGGQAAGAYVNLYSGNASTLPLNQVSSVTRDTFGMGAAVADFYPGTPGLELLIGSETDILVYFDYGLGPTFDVLPDKILSSVGSMTTMPGRNMVVQDINGDGYLDIVAFENDADHEGLVRTGAVHVYY